MGLIKPDLGKLVWFVAGTFLGGKLLRYVKG